MNAPGMPMGEAIAISVGAPFAIVAISALIILFFVGIGQEIEQAHEESLKRAARQRAKQSS